MQISNKFESSIVWLSVTNEGFFVLMWTNIRTIYIPGKEYERALVMLNVTASQLKKKQLSD